MISIQGVSAKIDISLFKCSQANFQGQSTNFLGAIKNNFREFRHFPRVRQVNPTADYSFERALYVSIVEFKVWAHLLYSNVPYINELMKVLRSLAVQIEKMQNESAVQIIEAQAMVLLAALQKILREANPRTDILSMIPTIPNLDYLMVILIRKAIRVPRNLNTSIKVSTSAIDKIEFSLEAVKIVSQIFQQVIQIYEKTPEFKQPDLLNGIYLGFCDNLVFSFYTYPSKPLIQLQQQRTIRLQSEPSTPVLRMSSIFQSRQVTKNVCDLCARTVSESESLNCNYKRYCRNCIFNPQVQLNMIPPDQIKKFVQQQKMQKQIRIICPVCEQVVTLKDYNPASKPQMYKCGKCKSIICIKHNLNAYTCMEMCQKCHIETYTDELLRLKICLKCKFRYCMNCLDCKCKCRCLRCSEPIAETQPHRCEFDKQCHQCLNTFEHMVQCSCGDKLCRTCALPRLEMTSDAKLFYRCPKR